VSVIVRAKARTYLRGKSKSRSLRDDSQKSKGKGGSRSLRDDNQKSKGNGHSSGLCVGRLVKQ
jgi:hypothetical protein